MYMIKMVLVALGMIVVVGMCVVIFLNRGKGGQGCVCYHVLRLMPGDDLKEGIVRFVGGQGLRAGFIQTCVGSLEVAYLRLANQGEGSCFEGDYEIVGLVGTLSRDGVHLHMSVADGEGTTVGGHLMDGCIVRTTAELVIGELRHMVFARERDDSTGHRELVVYPRC